MKHNWIMLAMMALLFSASVSSANTTRDSILEVANLLERSLSLYKENQYDSALILFRQVIAADPRCATAYLYAGHTCKKLSKPDEAQTYFKKAIEADVHLVDAYIEIGHFYTEHYRFAETEAILTEGLRCNPDNTHLLFQLATLYNTVNRDQESCDLFMEIKKRLPHNPSVLYNLAFTLKKLGRIQEAIPLYNHALQLNPTNSEIIFSRGLAYLTAGLFEQGFKDYEARWSRGQLGEAREFAYPVWDGQNLNGASLLLHAEQGFGDTFQFIRYAKVAKERGAGKITALVQNPLVTILSLCPYIDEVISLNQKPWPVADFHAPLGSLPYICKTRVDTVPASIPYLYADENLVELWKEKLSTDTNFKIGICWNGNSNYSTAQLRAIVAQKSVQLSQFKAISELSGISIYSLQKETGMDQLQDGSYGFNLRTFPETFDEVNGRFMDTAAVIRNLDLIITVDTGTAHLAAGLGAEVWILLPHPADWRWMDERLDTPWYPNVRLFRQPVAGDWNSVFKDVVAALEEKVSKTKKQSVSHEKKSKPVSVDETPVVQKTQILTDELAMKDGFLKEKEYIDQQLNSIRAKLVNQSELLMDEDYFNVLIQRWTLFYQLRTAVCKKIEALDLAIGA